LPFAAKAFVFERNHSMMALVGEAEAGNAGEQPAKE
jgi:hypothetical protein